MGKLKLGAYHNFGSLCYQRGEYQQALNLYRQCITIEPHYALAYYNLGLTHQQQNPEIAESLKEELKLVGLNLVDN